MANLTYDLFKITAHTNLHVGSGDINFGVVDNLVQKDVITELPTIHSSSLKGALREFFEEEMNKTVLAEYIFGPAPGSSATGEGNYKFFSAHLLSLPVRSNKNPFFRAFSPVMLNDFLSNLDLFSISLPIRNKIQTFVGAIQSTAGQPVIFDSTVILNEMVIEDFHPVIGTLPTGITINDITSLVGDDPTVFHHDAIKEFCANLPVIPRNQLKDGKSNNLWYEEVVPRQSCFYFIVGRPEAADPHYNDFISDIEGHPIQIGANASIGYGVCKIKKLNYKGKENAS